MGTTHHLSYRRKKSFAYGVFLAVPVFLYIAAFIYPVIDTAILSMQKWDGFSVPVFVGFQNYTDLFADPRFLNAFLNNLKWLVFFMVLPTIVGLGLALLLDDELKGSVVFRTVFFLPFTITTVAVGSAWRWMYKPGSGALSSLMTQMGLGAWAPNWLGDPQINTYAIMAATLWTWSGFTFLIYFAGLRGLPSELIEAARIDGAKFWTILLRIKLPLLWPSTAVVLGIAAIDSMKVFDIVWTMTQGGPYRTSSVLAVEMYETSFVMFKMGQGAAIAMILLIVAAIVVMPHIYSMSSKVEGIRE
jgi:multiple sugar transport system permease protein/raffinose/stachyose/melibiose transport system permease protein